MKTLSLWQPHILAICLGLKPYETRDWAMSYRGPLALHAAKRPFTDRDEWSNDARARLRRMLFPSVGDVEPVTSNLLLNRHLVYGAVCCVVDVVDCVPTYALRGKISPDHEFWGDFSNGARGTRYAFRLENIRVLIQPLPVRGQQGFWDVDLSGYALNCAPPLPGQLPALPPAPAQHTLFDVLERTSPAQ